MNGHLKVSNKMLDMIRKFEALRLKTYRDSVGVLTIGYGTTKAANVGIDPRLGMTITEDEANYYLRRYVEREAAKVLTLVTVHLEQNQFEAIMSLVYNIGIGNFASSTLLRLLNQKRYSEAGLQFLRWNKAQGKVLNGLTRRRKEEYEHFMAAPPLVTPTPTKTTTPAGGNFFEAILALVKGMFS